MADDVEKQGLPPSWSHLLGEFTSMEDVAQPIKISARIKYTSIAVSSKYLAIGANSGGIYIFQKDGWRYLQMLPGDNEGSVIQMAFSPDDNVLGYATSEGLVMVIALRIASRLKPDKIRSTHDHKGALVTALRWNASGDRLYVGDNMGHITLIKVKQVFSMSSETIMRLSSPVVQIDVCENKILVSTLVRCYLGNTSKQQFSHIGTKPRDGYYGACFYHGIGMEMPVVYCARPGSRMWEVDYDGNVLNTHQFKNLLNMPSLPIASSVDDSQDHLYQMGAAPGNQALNFPKLLLCGDQYLITWTEKAIYIFHPAEAHVLLWTSQLEGLHDIQVDRNDLYLLFADNRVRKLSLIPISKAVQRLMLQKKWKLAASLCLCFKSAISAVKARKHVPPSMLSDLKEHLVTDENLSGMVGDLDNLIDDLELDFVHSSGSSRGSRTGSVTSFERLNSGIYVIRRRTDSESLVEKHTANQDTIPMITDSGTSASDSHNGDVAILKESNEDASMHDFANGIDNGTVTERILRSNTESTKIGTLSDGPDQEKDEAVDSQSLTLSEEGSVVVDESSLKRVPSSESLQSLASLSSSELMFGPPAIDPEPVYSKTGGKIKQRGRRVRSAQIISLDEEYVDNKGSPKFSRSQSTTVLDKKRKKPLLKTSVSMSAVSEGGGQDSLQESGSSCSTNTPPAPAITVSQTTSDFTDNSPSDPIAVDMSDSPGQGSLVSSVEVDLEEKCSSSQGSAGEVPQSVEESSPRFTFLAVKDRISSKVSITARSLVRTIKDQKNRLTRKEDSPPVTEDDQMLVSKLVMDDEDIKETSEASNSEIVSKKQTFPKIDTSRLKEKTQITKSKMSEPSVLYNTAEAHVVLAEWAQELHHTLNTLHSAIVEENIQKLSHEETDTADNRIPVSDLRGLSPDCNDEDCSTLTTSGEESGYNSVVPSGDKNDDDSSVASGVDVKDVNEITSSMEMAMTCETVTDSCSQSEQFEESSTEHDAPCVPGKVEVPADNLNSQPFGDGSSIIVGISGERQSESTDTNLSNCKPVESYDMNSNSNNSSIHESYQCLARSDNEQDSEGKNSTLSDNEQENEGKNSTSYSQEYCSHQEESFSAENRYISSHTDIVKSDYLEGKTSTPELVEVLPKYNFKECIYLSDPFDLDPMTHSQVAELAMLCFEYKCHGDVSRYIDNFEADDSDVKLQESSKTVGSLSDSENFTCVVDVNNSVHQEGTLPSQQTLKCSAECQNVRNKLHIAPEMTPQTENSQDIVEQLEEMYSERGNPHCGGNLGCIRTNVHSNPESGIILDLPHDDIELGLMLQYYFHLYEGQLEQVQDVIYKSKGSRLHRWKSLLSCEAVLGHNDLVSEKLSQNDVEGAFDLLRSGLHQERKAMLAHLHSLFLIAPLKVLEFCYENRQSISPVAVLYMCHELSKEKYSAHICFYAEKFLTPAQAETRLEELCKDPEVLLSCLECLLQTCAPRVQPTPLHCECGYPWPGSHLPQWSMQSQINALLSMVQRQAPQALQLLTKYGYWYGYLNWTHDSISDQQRAATVLQLGDITLFQPDSKIGCHPKCEEDWTTLLKLKEKQHYDSILKAGVTCYQHFCLSCGKNLYDIHESSKSKTSDFEVISQDSLLYGDAGLVEAQNGRPESDCTGLPIVSWESIARLLVEDVGVYRAMEMLKSSHVSDNALSPEFYTDCAAATILESRQRSVVQNLLERIDTYLWSSRSSVMQPQLLAALNEEKQRKHDTRADSSLEKLVSSTAGSSNLRGTLEDPECHWGVNTDVNSSCGVCGLVLLDQISRLEPGAIFFQCGHGYHRACLPEHVCLLCVSW